MVVFFNFKCIELFTEESYHALKYMLSVINGGIAWMKETCEKVQKFWHKLGCERKAERVYEIWKGDKMRVSGNPW